MFNILLVDDEPIVRIGLKTVVDWNCMGFHIAGEAGNGREAMEIFGQIKIDVLATDIKMPVMDGIELISAAKKMNPDLIVIALSSYDDYEYVQKAFRLGIYDYILKSDINEKKITKLFKEILTELDTTDGKTEEQSDEENKTNDKITERKKLIVELISEENDFSPKGAADKLLALDCDIGNKYVVLALLSVYKYIAVKSRYSGENVSKLYLYIKNIIEEARGKYGDLCEIQVAENDFLLMFVYPKSTSVEKLREIVTDVCSHIMMQAKRFININTVFGVSNISSDEYADIRRLYKNAKAAQKYFFIDGAGRTIWYYQIEKSELRESEQEINDYIARFKKILYRDFIEDYNAMVKSVIVQKSSLCDFCVDSIKKIYSLYSMLLFEYTELNSVSEDLKEAINKYIYLFKCESSLNELNGVLEEILLNLHTFNVLDRNPVVEKVKRYANKNYNMPITSRDAAQDLEVTQEHLCRLFSHETGISFTKYLTELRMEKAKELLLQGNIKIKQVGNMVGYTNSYYFCKVFKKATGFTPTEYAKRHATAG